MTTAEKIREREKELAIETQKKLDNIAIGDTIYGADLIFGDGAYEIGKVVDVARWQLHNTFYMVKVCPNCAKPYFFIAEEYGNTFFLDKEQAEEYFKRHKR